METIGQTAYEYMKANNRRFISYGDPELCHTIGELAGVYERCKTVHGSHPLNIITKVLNGVSRDSRFRVGYIQHLNFKYRVFEIIG